MPKANATKSTEPATEPAEVALPETRIVQVNVSNLRVNPALNSVPMLSSVAAFHLGGKSPHAKQLGADIAAEKDALWASLDRDGIIEPLKAHLDQSTGLWIVDDGRHRLEWAMSRGPEVVPVIAVTEAQGSALVESTVIGRRHWTKGQRAYLGVLLHPEVASTGKGRPAKNADSIGYLTGADLAERLGVSTDIIQQAAELYRAFHAPGAKKGSPEAIEAADKKTKYEMAIWSGCGLGAVIAGIGGGVATKDKPRAESGFHGLDKPLGTLIRFGDLFTKWDEGERAKALRLMTERFKADMTPEFRLALSEALAAAEG